MKDGGFNISVVIIFSSLQYRSHEGRKTFRKKNERRHNIKDDIDRPRGPPKPEKDGIYTDSHPKEEVHDEKANQSEFHH